jgi:hypothetical protein
LDRSPAAGSQLPDITGIWTDQWTLLGAISSRFWASAGLGSERKKPMHCKRKPKLLEKQNLIFLKIKCIAFARISTHFFLPHMDLKILFLLIE